MPVNGHDISNNMQQAAKAVENVTSNLSVINTSATDADHASKELLLAFTVWRNTPVQHVRGGALGAVWAPVHWGTLVCWHPTRARDDPTFVTTIVGAVSPSELPGPRRALHLIVSLATWHFTPYSRLPLVTAMVLSFPRTTHGRLLPNKTTPIGPAGRRSQSRSRCVRTSGFPNHSESPA